jgi:hypothetical protein
MNVDVLIGQNFTELDDIKCVKTSKTLQFSKICSGVYVNSIEKSIVNVGIEDSSTVEKVLGLLNEYSMCVASSTSEVGKTSAFKMTIQLTTSHPISYRPRRYSDSERAEIRVIVNDLLTNGIIGESSSPYASPVLLVGKKTGDKRLCVDYRALNRVTVKDRYPLPLIEDQLTRLAGCKYFTNFGFVFWVPSNTGSRRVY